MSATTEKLITAEELLALPDDGFRYELVEGELRRMSPAGHNHGRIAVRLTVPLARHVEVKGLGEVYAAETGFKLKSNPDTVRAPDIAFVSRQRVEEIGDVEGYFPGAPDLAVEVLSPSDKASRVEEKVREWLEAGTKLVWVVSPQRRTVMAYRSPTDIKVLTDEDTLEGGEVIWGFQYPIAKLFAIKSRKE